jgi:ribosome maturation factor RimP
MRRGQKSPILLLKSMITREQVEHIIHEKIAGTEIFLVAVIMNPGNNIHVHLDTIKGINIDECVEVSRYIISKIDKDIEDYNLEVSSPGLDATFIVKQQYEKNLGKQVEIVKNDGSKIKAKLLTYSDDKIEVEQMVKPSPPAKSKKLVSQMITVVLKDIKTIKSVISFK